MSASWCTNSRFEASEIRPEAIAHDRVRELQFEAGDQLRIDRELDRNRCPRIAAGASRQVSRFLQGSPPATVRRTEVPSAPTRARVASRELRESRRDALDKARRRAPFGNRSCSLLAISTASRPARSSAASASVRVRLDLALAAVAKLSASAWASAERGFRGRRLGFDRLQRLAAVLGERAVSAAAFSPRRSPPPPGPLAPRRAAFGRLLPPDDVHHRAEQEARQQPDRGRGH